MFCDYLPQPMCFLFAFRPYYIVCEKYMISSQNRHSERIIPEMWDSYISIDLDELMSLCLYVCMCVYVSVDTHTHTLLEVFISILFHFNIITHVNLAKIKIVWKMGYVTPIVEIGLCSKVPLNTLEVVILIRLLSNFKHIVVG